MKAGCDDIMASLEFYITTEKIILIQDVNGESMKEFAEKNGPTKTHTLAPRQCTDPNHDY